METFENDRTMRRNREQLRISASRQAFTLVELLVVCAVIVLLAALTLFAVSKVAHSAKVAKTRATIQKLEAAIQPIFESYESKFLNIRSQLANMDPPLDEAIQQQIAAHFIRDLMRMEMPQNWKEVETPPITITINGKTYTPDESPLRVYYKDAAAGKSPSRSALLFLIIQNLNPEALEAFHGSEVADTDGDGLLEFVDAWGRPIQFLRWAPAFPDSDLQQNVLALCEPKYVPQRNVEDNRWWLARDDRLKAAMVKASEQHPFLLDEQTNPTGIGWFLYPLIYSAGPDGKYGIDEGDDSPPTVGTDGILDPFEYPYGMPNGSSHLDNIHNHQWYRSY